MKLIRRLSLNQFLIESEVNKYTNFADLIETFLKDEKNRFVKAIPEGLTDEELEEYWDYYGDTYFELDRDLPSVLRYSVFTQAYSFLEHALLNYCKDALKDFQLTISHKDLNGNGINKYHKYLTKVVGLNFPDDTDEWKVIKAYNIIRNCISHALGNIEDTTNQKKITQAVNELKHVHIDNSKISFDENFCFEALKNIKNFLDKLEDAYRNHINLRNS